MKIRRILAGLLASFAAMLFMGSVTVNAEELSYSELVSRLTALEAEMHSQRNNMGSYYGDACDQGGCLGECPTIHGCNHPTWYAGYEVTFLRPYLSEFAGPGGGWGEGYGAGHRFSIGYEGANGLGGRVRHWMYNHNHGGAGGNPLVDIDMDAFDAEVTLRERMRNWDLLVSGGLRYGRAAFDFGGGDAYFEGTGPTFALEAIRNVGSRGFYLIGNARASMLFGRIGGPGAGAAPLFGIAADDETGVVLENQLGIGWSRDTSYGLWNVRGVWESQYWYNSTLADDFNGLESALGLAGPSFMVELQF
jgi:hypothetical protein